MINLIFVRFHADDHIRDGAAAPLSNPRWRDDDNTIVLWFFATIAGDLLDVVAPAGSTAYTIWRRLHEYFLENEAELVMHLGQEFRAAVRGDQSINDYFHRLQGLAAALADVREQVTDRTLTLQMSDGLGKKFELQAAIIQSTVPLPTFAQARSRLVLAELALDKRARAEGAQILAVHSGNNRGGDRNGGRGGDRGYRSAQGGGDRGPPGGGGVGRGADRAARGRNRGGGRGGVAVAVVAVTLPRWLGHPATLAGVFRAHGHALPPTACSLDPAELGRRPRPPPWCAHARLPRDAAFCSARALLHAVLMGRLGDVPLCAKLRGGLPCSSRVDYGHGRIIRCHWEPRTFKPRRSF
ncbi:uncharacterized protein LOC125556464 [Triticum urartu]|uniref:uncharacterized protein LOC125556464 n=1 Tax=Triticum urartu TaxID=4572 RepID=UPI002043516C|nr:uncharacterized protein LOC125556464 [Triticum urartu]